MSSLHSRVTTGEQQEDLDPVVAQLRDCSSLYVRLEDCLVEHNRDWRKCQKAVSALKECTDAQRINEQQQQEGKEKGKTEASLEQKGTSAVALADHTSSTP